ncbi:MAG: hypothetical protein ACQESF_01445 [Nanobdellota archaeon]
MGGEYRLKTFLGLLIIISVLCVPVFGYTIKGGEIHLVRPNNNYIDSNHIPPEYLSNEDLFFYTCIEEENVPLRTSVLCKDDNSFQDIDLYNWDKGSNCYLGSYDLNEKDCRNIVIESEYVKDEEVMKIRKELQVNRFSSLLDLVSTEQYSDGGWKNATETASGIWVLSNYRDIFDDEIVLANKWLKLNRNNEMKCWPNEDCDVRDTAKILSFLTLAENNDSLRIMHDGNIFLKKKQNYYEPGDKWNLTINPFEDGITECVITYKRNHLNDKEFKINENQTQYYQLDASYGERLIVICDQNIDANLATDKGEEVFIYEGDNLTYTLPYACWPRDDQWGKCDPRATLYAMTTDIDQTRKDAAYQYLEDKREQARGEEEFVEAGDNLVNTALYSFVLGNNSVSKYNKEGLVAWLRFRQNNNGSWGYGGFQEMIKPTGFSIQGLMSNGFSRNHEVIQDAESWINNRELELSKNKTAEYKGWNSTEKNALAFTVLKNNARPVLKFSPKIIILDKNNKEVDVYNPTTFPLEDVTYEFSDNLKDKVKIEKKRELIPAFSYVKLKLQKNKKELSNIHGYLTIYNLGKEITRVPVMVANFPTIKINPKKDHLKVFGKSSPLYFNVDKTSHNFDCKLTWDEEDISSKTDLRINSNSLKIDVSFDKAERLENTYHGEFECKAMNQDFVLPFSIDISRYATFPFTVEPQRIKVNKTSQNKNFTIKNNLDESLQVDVDFQRNTGDFGFSSTSVVVDPNGEESITIYNNAAPLTNITHTNTIKVNALDQEKTINFRAFIYHDKEKKESGLFFWVFLVVFIVLLGVLGYLSYFYKDFFLNLFKKESSVDKVKMKIKKLEQKEKNTAVLNMIQIMRMQNKEEKDIKGRLKEEGFSDEEIDNGFKLEKGEVEESSGDEDNKANS